MSVFTHEPHVTWKVRCQDEKTGSSNIICVDLRNEFTSSAATLVFYSQADILGGLTSHFDDPDGPGRALVGRMLLRECVLRIRGVREVSTDEEWWLIVKLKPSVSVERRKAIELLVVNALVKAGGLKTLGITTTRNRDY